MENNPGFNLEAAVAAWRAHLAGAALNEDAVRELEAHLRESVERLQETGCAEEDAFAIATYRLGQAGPLAAEFLKLDPGRSRRNRLGWFTAGLLASYAGPTALSLISTSLTRGLSRWGVASGGWWWAAETVAFLGVLGLMVALAAKAAGSQRVLPRPTAGSRGPAAAFTAVAGISALLLGVGWMDSRLVGATPADGFGAMLFAGCAIERASASMVHAAFIVLFAAVLLGLESWPFRRVPRA